MSRPANIFRKLLYGILTLIFAYTGLMSIFVGKSYESSIARSRGRAGTLNEAFASETIIFGCILLGLSLIFLWLFIRIFRAKQDIIENNNQVISANMASAYPDLDAVSARELTPQTEAKPAMQNSNINEQS